MSVCFVRRESRLVRRRQRREYGRLIRRMFVAHQIHRLLFDFNGPMDIVRVGLDILRFKFGLQRIAETKEVSRVDIGIFRSDFDCLFFQFDGALKTRGFRLSCVRRESRVQGIAV